MPEPLVSESERARARALHRKLGGVVPEFPDPSDYLDMADERTCRVCGCVEWSPCETEGGPCGWAGADLCTACEGRPAAIRDALAELAKCAEAVLVLREAARDGLELGRGRRLALYILALEQLRDVACRAQQLLDATRWPIAFDEIADYEQAFGGKAGR